MEKRLILELKNHDVYYIKNKDIRYYITIPKAYDTTNICIELKSKMNNYDLDTSDEVWVMENVKNTFSYIDNYNITLVLPILNDELHDALEKIDTSKYDSIDTLLCDLINNAYMNLKENDKNIESEIILINNERYKSFINWFTTKYQNRIVCRTLLNVIQTYNVNATSYKKYETPAITFVVGSYNNEITAPKIVPEDDYKEEAPTKLVPQTSSGFTSYWLLVTITIVVAGIVAFISFMMKR